MRSLRILSIGAGILVASLLGSQTATASPIEYDSFKGTIIDFDDLALGTVLTDQYAKLGVTFSILKSTAVITDTLSKLPGTLNSAPNSVLVADRAGSGISINFDEARSRVGVLLDLSSNASYTVQAYSGAKLLESITATPDPLPGGLTQAFVALEDVGITSLVMYSTSGSFEMFSTGPLSNHLNFSFDDLKFDAPAGSPEPTSLLLIGVGGLAFLSVAGRRLAAARA